jgi:ADP-ribose pyrophosphatase
MKILENVQLTESPWIRLRQIVYENNDGQMLRWDYIERLNARGSVLIMPCFKQSRDFVLIRQYRVILDRHVIGFPAGVVAEDEDIETCAMRELLEETGYTGRVVQISPQLTLNSALISETAHCVVVELEEDATPMEQQLEPSEQIEVFRVSKKQLGPFFEQAAAKGDLIAAAPWLMLMVVQGDRSA